jgi:hypothetical protein
MSITLHAIVERYVPASEHRSAGWTDVAEWNDFGAHYVLKDWLYNNAPRGWPKDFHGHEYPDYDKFEIIDQDRRWTTPLDTREALKKVKREARHDQHVYVEPLEALLAAVAVYEAAGQRVRILWGCT